MPAGSITATMDIFYLKKKNSLPQLHIDEGDVLPNILRLRKHEVLREIRKVVRPPSSEMSVSLSLSLSLCISVLSDAASI